MGFEYINREYDSQYYDNKISNRFQFTRYIRVGKLALIYGFLGAAITLGILLLIAFIGFLIEGKIIFVIGTGALSYTLLYGSYGLIKKKKALDMFSPYIFK